MGRLAGKVAFITGAARGQGRSHAISLAREGADIIAVDISTKVGSVPYGLATADDLAETVREVEALGRRIVATEADVRDLGALTKAVDHGVAELGRLDVVVANAGIFSFGPLAELEEQQFQDMIDINLVGVWRTVKAAVPHVRAGGRGGSVVLISSAAGLQGMPYLGHYAAAKHGVVGIMRTLALELAPENIRVNTLHPTAVNTPMIRNAAADALFAPDLPEEERTLEVLAPRYQSLNAMPVPWIEPADVSHAVVWLASDEAAYVTGVTLPIDAGTLIK